MSDDTFAPRPVNLASERGVDRPALSGDPLSYTQSQLIQAGYGLRPDPQKDAAAYARWLGAASAPGRLLEAKRRSSHSHTVSTGTGAPWTGSVLTGAPNYIATEATFNVPTAVPGGDATTGTEIAIWNGLGGNGTGSGLIQGGVGLATTSTTATYLSWREYCCGDLDSNGYGGAFTPNPGDQIYSQAWYCDSAGNLNLNGGYGCTYLQDLNTGAILSCTSATGSPCWSVQAIPSCSVSPGTPNCMTLGLAAEFVIENQSPQLSPPTTAFTDFSPAVNMHGSAYTDQTGSYSQTIINDPVVTILTDFTNTTTHMNVSLGTTDQTYFNITRYAKPQIQITSPADGSTITVSPYVPVTFTATAADQIDGQWPLSQGYKSGGATPITWSSDVDGPFPESGFDRSGGTSMPFDFTNAPEGLRHVTASVTNSVGLTSTATIAVTTKFNRVTPAPVITWPPPGTSVAAGKYIVTGYAKSTDPGVLGNFDCSKLVWNGSAQAVPVPNSNGQCEAQLTFAAGVQQITLSATDKFGDTGKASVSLTVTSQSGLSVQILSPTNNSFDVVVLGSYSTIGLSGNAAPKAPNSQMSYTWYWYFNSAGSASKKQIGIGQNITWTAQSSAVCHGAGAQNITIELDALDQTYAALPRHGQSTSGSASVKVVLNCESLN
jgi:hypothetical protein